MAAEMVSSALAQEAINHALSRFKEMYKGNSDAKEHVERMEMAHIKMETALETSNRWNITSVPLLRWQRKLKRAAQECDHTLRRCRQRFQEEEEVQKGIRSSSLPKRIAHNARSLVSSIFSRSDNDELRGSNVVRRFERFADGASEFLRYVEVGGTPHRHMFFDPLIRHLLAGKGTKYCFVRGGQHLSFVLEPFRGAEQGMEGFLVFLLEDVNAPQNNFLLSLTFQLSESTNIVGVVVRCLELFIPHLSSTAETVKTKLTQVYLLGHVPLSVGNKRQRSPVDGESQTSSMRDFEYLKLGAHFWPHASSKDWSPAVGGSASEIINGEAMQRDVNTNISIEQLGEILIPKAVDCLHKNVAATSYQMLWKSKHGGAYLRLEKISSCNAATWNDRIGKRPKQHRDKEVQIQGWTSADNEFVTSWIAHTPVQLRDSIMDYWIQKGKQETVPLLLKTNACVHDCPIMLLSTLDHRSLARKIKSFSRFNT